jgi:hypothetical protein
MYIRYQSKEMNEHSHSCSGVFVEIHKLRDQNALEKHEESQVIPCLKWLGMHLKAPVILKEPGNHRALSWFKDSAKEPLKRIRILVTVLHEHGVPIELLKITDPGVVIYEDGWQIVAKPYKKGKEYNKANPADARYARDG